MGELEGKHVDVVLDHAPRDMEPVSRMMERAYAWWCEAVVPWVKAQGATELDNGGETTEGRRDVLIVSHGGFIGALVQTLRNKSMQVENGVRLTKCRNASVTVIEVDSGSAKGKMTRYSDISHLTGPIVERNVDVQDALPGV